jgi:hypothetical protein
MEPDGWINNRVRDRALLAPPPRDTPQNVSARNRKNTVIVMSPEALQTSFLSANTTKKFHALNVRRDGDRK